MGEKEKEMNPTSTWSKLSKLIRSFGVLVLVISSLTVSSPVIATAVPLSITTDTTLTADHIGNIFMSADGITLDCAGHMVVGPGIGGVGITLFGRTGVTVKNCFVTGFQRGFWISGGSGNTLQGNTAEGLGTSSGRGFFIENSSNNNTLEENTAFNHADEGFRVGGSSSENILRGNLAMNNAVSGFLLIVSTNNIIEGNTAMDNGVTVDGTVGTGTGFRVFFSDGNTFEKNTANNNKTGFGLSDSSGNTIFHNNIINNTSQAFDSNAVATDWHDPISEEGNFWSNYPGVDNGSGTGKHAIAGDGIGDTIIPFPFPNGDNFPFIAENGWIASPPAPTNQPPVAVCQDVTVPADSSCTADASVDAGSVDPDGDPITLAHNPSSPYPLGITSPVTLTVTDDKAASTSCSATVTVVDTTPPTVTAALVPVGEGDDDDDDSDEGRFRVEFSCADTCAAISSTTATLNGIAVVDGQVVELEIDDETEVEVEDGILEIEAPSFSLDVTCTDAFGNVGTAQATPTLGPDNDEVDND